MIEIMKQRKRGMHGSKYLPKEKEDCDWKKNRGQAGSPRQA